MKRAPCWTWNKAAIKTEVPEYPPSQNVRYTKVINTSSKKKKHSNEHQEGDHQR